MKINTAGLDLIKEFESCRLHSYRDVTGTWTIGWGHTGSDVHPNQVISQERADHLLAGDVLEFEEALNKFLGDAPTNENQFSAMVCLFYNLGTGWIPRASVTRFHRRGAYLRAAASFLLFLKSKGRKLRGLLRRRNAERKLYLKPV